MPVICEALLPLEFVILREAKVSVLISCFDITSPSKPGTKPYYEPTTLFCYIF